MRNISKIFFVNDNINIFLTYRGGTDQADFKLPWVGRLDYKEGS